MTRASTQTARSNRVRRPRGRDETSTQRVRVGPARARLLVPIDFSKGSLVTLAQRHVDPVVPVNPRVRQGKPCAEIVAAARDLNIDLIVLATRGYTGLRHVLLGSTAEQVVRHAPCPVRVVRERERDFIEQQEPA